MMRPFALLLLAAATSGTASAHHSTAIYDSENPIELAGTVVEWQFVNPHCVIVLDVADAASGSNTAMLFRRGWTPETLKPGDQILVTVRPLRSGALGGNYSNVRWPDGKPVDPRPGNGAN
jgi:hypothetical protein